MKFTPEINSHTDLVDLMYAIHGLAVAIDLIIGPAETPPRAGGAVRQIAATLEAIAAWMVDAADDGALRLAATADGVTETTASG